MPPGTYAQTGLDEKVSNAHVLGDEVHPRL